jgi:co-chaperonin GroES (HSP10)
MFNDTVLVRLDPEDSKICDGLLVKPEIAHSHVFRTGEAVAVGPGKWAAKADVRVPTGINVGDGVVFVKFVATHTKTAESIQHVIGKDLSILHESDILLVYDRKDVPEIGQ